MTTNLKEIKSLIKKHEGFEPRVYKCSAGSWTLGFGRNVDKGGKGITENEADYLLTNDVIECVEDLNKIFANFPDFSHNRKSALVNMRFQLGPVRFRGFKKMIDAVNMNNWVLAMMEARDSQWYKQVPNRSKEVTEMFLEE